VKRFKPSNNDYDWLGPGIYFWESNPVRGLEFAAEAARRRGVESEPAVIGAVLDLGNCLDLTTATGLGYVRTACEALVDAARPGGLTLPRNSNDGLRRRLDCAVITRLHSVLQESNMPPIDTVKAIFVEGGPIYPDAGFYEKTHTQIAVCNPRCIRGVFRVPSDHLR